MKTEVVNNGRTFEPQNLENVQLSVDTSLTGRALDVDTATFDISTGEGRQLFLTNFPRFFFTRDNLLFNANDSFDFSWDQASPIQLKRGGSQYGIFFPRSAARYKTNAYSLSCTSALGKLAQMAHRGGVYTGSTGDNPMTVGALVREICGYSNGSPTGITVIVASAFESIPVRGWLPAVSPSGEDGATVGSAKDNLLQVLFFANATVRDDVEGNLIIDNLDTRVKSAITSDRIYRDNAKVIDEIPVTAVSLLEHAWIKNTSEDNRRILFEGAATEGQTIMFDDPMSGLIWQTNADPPVPLTILKSGANYATLSAGTGTLSGIPYDHITREHRASVSEADTENIEYIEDATLVDSYAATDILTHLVDYYQHRKTIRVEALIEDEDAGDVVSIWDPFDKVMRQACIESIASIEASSVMRGLVSAIVGYTPYQVAPFVNEHIIIDAAWIQEHGSTFTFPDTLNPSTVVDVVLIGGGQGGYNGKNSDSVRGGTKSAYAVVPKGVTKTISIDSSSGAAGGDGGNGGLGGKIWLGQITVNPSQQINNLSVGARGAKNGGLGGATTFGTLSSENGSTNNSGYYDPVTETTYGLPGSNGVAGQSGKTGTSVQGDPYSDEKVTVGPGGDGGASADNPGTEGRRIRDYSNGVSYSSYGGNGGNGSDKANATVYGCGGDGGNGGGGPGSSSGGSFTFYNRFGPNSISIYLYGYQGARGYGGQGGRGASGCIILTFRKPST